MNRLLHYDFARFCAISAVIIVHSAQVTNNSVVPISIYELGRFGVQLFFVISGATVMLTYQSILNSYSHPNLVFYCRRFFRIVPLFMMCGLYYSFLKAEPVLVTLNPMSAFDPNKINVIAGGWSIWNELYFYMVFPAYFLLRSNLYSVFAIAVFCAVISIFINLRMFGLWPDSHEFLTFDYENMFTQFVCFAVGVELAKRNFKSIAILVFLNVVIGAMSKVIFFPDLLLKSDRGATYWTGTISLLAVLFVLFVEHIFKKGGVRDNLIVGLLCKLGTVTYSAYMIHFFVIEMFRDRLTNGNAELNIIFVASITFVISLLVKNYTEEIWSNIGRRCSSYYQIKQKV